MKNSTWNLSGAIFGAVAGALAILSVAGSTPASAQAPDAAERCTPDVMRLCSEYIPDANRIVGCLKAKRRQLSPSCRSALTSGGGSKAKQRRARRHNS